MVAEQTTCPKTQRLITGNSSLKIEFQDIQGHRLAEDTSTGMWRPLQHYLGMVNFYPRFTPGIAAVLEPLTTALKGGKKTLERTPALNSAFQRSKQVLAAAVPLA
jgi:hypothetical protein